MPQLRNESFQNWEVVSFTDLFFARDLKNFGGYAWSLAVRVGESGGTFFFCAPLYIRVFSRRCVIELVFLLGGCVGIDSCSNSVCPRLRAPKMCLDHSNIQPTIITDIQPTVTESRFGCVKICHSRDRRQTISSRDW